MSDAGSRDSRNLGAPVNRSSEPIFNVPPVVTVMILIMGMIHAVRVLVLSPANDRLVLAMFAFIPARYDAAVLGDGGYPGGIAAEVYTFVTYALLHGDWSHIGLNAVWFLAFGTPVARRFGALRFLIFFAVAAVAGALAHLMTFGGELAPMVGASAAISGYMAAAMRFAFQGGGPLDLLRRHEPDAYRVPAPPLAATLRDPRIIAFLVVWFGLNILFGVGTLSIGEGDAPIAWQAHIGGFLTGLLLFAAFDPIGRGPPPADAPPPASEATLH